MRLTHRTTPIALLSLLLVLVSACGSPSGGVDRRAILGELVNTVFVPTTASLATKTSSFDSAVTAFCAAPDTTKLGDARTAWRTAREEYMRAEAFGFGPWMTLNVRASLDFPIVTTDIDALLADTATTIDASTVGLLAGGKGFLAAEYLMFPGGDDAAVVALFTDVSAGPRRCAYLTTVSALMKSKATELATAWSPTGGNYGNELLTAGQGGTAYTNLSGAVTEVVHQMWAVMHEAADVRLGRPLGLVNSVPTTSPDGTLAEAHRSGQSLRDLAANLDGLESVYYGRYGSVDMRGIQDMILDRSAAEDALFVGKLAAARAALDAIPETLSTSVTSQTALVMAAFDALKQVQTELATSFGSLLGLSDAMWTDND